MFSIKNLLKIGWVILCIGILIQFLLHPESWTNYEVTMLLGIEMMVISFPVGLLVWLWVWVFGFIFPDMVVLPQVSVPLYWVTLMLIGYLQWFKLVPWIYYKVKHHGK